MQNFLYLCAVLVIGTGAAYLVYRFKDPRRQLNGTESMIYRSVEGILRAYPDRRFFGKRTYEEDWFCRLREAYVGITRRIAGKAADTAPGSVEYAVYSTILSGENPFFTDTVFLIELIGTLSDSTSTTHFFGEDQTIRKACLLELRSRLARQRDRHPLDPTIVEFYGAEYIDAILSHETNPFHPPVPLNSL